VLSYQISDIATDLIKSTKNANIFYHGWSKHIRTSTISVYGDSVKYMNDAEDSVKKEKLNGATLSSYLIL
jgi:hypothetical protein